ncbi:PD40 domain-containing protein [Brevibacillus migulae]|uniref:PD40 domain-containing protein n=1 Tax=Brevibacillus migulae TaxID=1644114 RepID=UPI001431C0A8|nr:PD40 domain-containing protein [Brevibacillus migulae]
MKYVSRFVVCLFTLSILMGIGSGSDNTYAAAAPVQESANPGGVPAKIAFTRNQQLWMLDAANPKAVPKQVTRSGNVEVIGWSYDGEYLLYKNRGKQDANEFSYLWVVQADGSNPRQVDPRPVQGTPKWSPHEHTIAYLTGNPPDQMMVTLATVRAKQQVRTRQLPFSPEAADIAWSPDGKSLYVSLPAAKDRPIQLNKVSVLNGIITEMYRLGGPPKVEEGIYPYLADGITLSPDGRYVAYFERVTSASLSADGLPIKLFDFTTSAAPKVIGAGLAYPEWLAWSPDSKRLAIVDGTGREATANKHVVLIDPATGSKLFDSKEAGLVDTQPVWSQGKNSVLYFARGRENRDWLGNYDPNRLLVPDQRIWAYYGIGKPVPVTRDQGKTADLYANPSPTNQFLLFLRLYQTEHGSVFVKTLGKGTETELIKDVNGEAGYYGNYLPEWVKVYWMEEK